MTLISVLTPSYNYARFLPVAVASALSQGADAEVLVADGGSADGTVEYLRQTSDPRLKWVSEPDKGQSDALNKALRMSAGSIIGWLNADDFYLPGAFARIEREFEDPDVQVVFGDTLLVDAEGRFTRLYKLYDVPIKVLEWRGCVYMSTAMFFRRSILGENPWDPTLRVVMDWDLFLRLRKTDRAVFRYVPQPLAAFRVHSAQVTSARLSPRFDEYLTVRRRFGRTAAAPSLFAAAGSLVHKLHKVAAGATYEEAKARVSRGTPLMNAGGELDFEANAELVNRLTRNPRSRSRAR